MSRSLTLLITALMLASCSSMYYDFHQEPFSFHGTNTLKSQTAVLSVMETTTVPANGITSVDGTLLNCVKAGCPMWVRVSAGSHKFVVRRKENYGLGYKSINWDEAELEVEVDDMLPKHVYLVIISRQGDRFTHETKDLGESPDYGITLGKGGNRAYHRVSF